MLTTLYLVEVRDDAGHHLLTALGASEAQAQAIAVRSVLRLLAMGLGPFTCLDRQETIVLRGVAELRAYISRVRSRTPAAVGDLAGGAGGVYGHRN